MLGECTYICEKAVDVYTTHCNAKYTFFFVHIICYTVNVKVTMALQVHFLGGRGEGRRGKGWRFNSDSCIDYNELLCMTQDIEGTKLCVFNQNSKILLNYYLLLD